MVTRAEVEIRLSKIYWPPGVQAWINAPSEAFGGKSAADLLAEGRGDEVLAAIERTER